MVEIDSLIIMKLIIINVSIDVTEKKTDLYSGRVSICVTMSGLITVSADGNMEFISDSFSHLFLGYTRNDLVGKVRCAYLTFINPSQPEIVIYFNIYHHILWF